MRTILETERLVISELNETHADFVFTLFNDPDCIRFIGDRGIRTKTDAQAYLKDKLIASYQDHGYGLFNVSMKDHEVSMGICGLVKRDPENPPDIGFAFLPDHRGKGYCTEAGAAVLSWAKEHQISDTILAYTNPENEASISVLQKLGLEKQTITTLPGQDFESLIMSISMV